MLSLRVIAGDFKGRRLESPKGTDVRPTADRVKEAIFSMVQLYIQNAVCLDLFAGTGSLGIEALSRGASKVYFCDSAPASLAAVRKNLDICRADSRHAVVITSDWRGACAGMKEKCNLVFIDAPFEMCEHYPQILATLAEKCVLDKNARIIIERNDRKGGYALPQGFTRLSEKRYGSIGVDLLLFNDDGDDGEEK